MRETFPDKKRGDPLTAAEVTNLNRVARTFGSESGEGFHGFFRATPSRRIKLSKLVELKAKETATRNTPYQCLLGTWNAATQLWDYDGTSETVYAIDHRYDSPHAEEDWTGLYQAMPSSGSGHNGVIYVCVSLDCEEPE